MGAGCCSRRRIHAGCVAGQQGVSTTHVIRRMPSSAAVKTANAKCQASGMCGDGMLLCYSARCALLVQEVAERIGQCVWSSCSRANVAPSSSYEGVRSSQYTEEGHATDVQAAIAEPHACMTCSNKHARASNSLDLRPCPAPSYLSSVS